MLQSTDGLSYVIGLDAGASTVPEKYALTLHIATGRLTGAVLLGSEPTPVQAVTGWINPWSVTSPSAQWQSYCTASLSPVVAVTDFDATPGGSGFTTMSISTTGNVGLVGRMADGSVATLSTSLSPTQRNLDNTDAVEIPVFLLSSDGLGSILGAARLNQSDASMAKYHEVTGVLSWVKTPAPATSKSRNYKAGIARHALKISGAGYAAPADGLPILGALASSSNASLAVSGAGIASAAQMSAIGLPFTLTGSAAAQFLAPNTIAHKLTVDRAHGTFAGSFTLVDPSPVNPSLKAIRPVLYYGVLLSNMSSGEGFFLLPTIPPPPSTVTTSPIQSGKITLGVVK
jgi:hypothetical protein